MLINYNPSCMSVRYSTHHVHYPQLNPSRVCLPTNFQKFKCHIFMCLCVCQYLWIIKFLEWAYRKKWGIWGFIIRLILLRFSFVFYINLPIRKSNRMALSFRFWALFDYWFFRLVTFNPHELLIGFVCFCELSLLNAPWRTVPLLLPLFGSVPTYLA